MKLLTLRSAQRAGASHEFESWNCLASKECSRETLLWPFNTFGGLTKEIHQDSKANSFTLKEGRLTLARRNKFVYTEHGEMIQQLPHHL